MRKTLLTLLTIFLLPVGPPAIADGVQGAGFFFPDSGAPEAVRERLANQILGKYRRNDPEFDDYYRQAVSLLTPNDNYLIVNAKVDSVNAFAHFGGFVAVMDGMWLFTHNEDELLGIIAHEIGHIKNDHFTRQKEKSKTVSALSVPLLIAGILHDDPELRQALIVGSSGILSSQIYAYTRALEHEADIFALNLMNRAKRNSHSLGEAFGRLAGGGYNEYVSTHPAPLRRASYLSDRLREQSTPPNINSLSYLLLRQKIITTGRVNRKIKEELKKALTNKGDAKAVAQYGLILLSTKSREKALGEEMQAALGNAEHPFILAAIAENLSRLGDKEKALTVLKKAHTNHPHSAALSLALIKTLAQTGRRKEAIALYETMPPDIKNRPDVLKQTALAADKDKALMNYFLAAGHFHNGDFELAVRQSTIAEKQKANPEMLLKISKIKKMALKELRLLKKRKS